MLNSHLRRTWAEIDLDAAAHNFRVIKEHCGTKLCCVIKANAYGHGAIRLAQLYESLGVDHLAVSNIEEAFELRNAGIRTPLLILGYTPCECAKALSKNDITQCVYSLDYARALSAVACLKGVSVKCHLKIDSGMGRIGFTDMNEALEATKLEGLKINGIFTHFSSADEGEDGKEYTEGQYRKFMDFVSFLESEGVNFEYRHCSNSAAILDYSAYGLDMVRAGIVLYGLAPSEDVKEKLDLRPCMSFKSVVTHIKEVEEGTSISYGRHYTADGKRRIATVAVGYADGYFRQNSSVSDVLINGQRAPIRGNVCMDQLMVDVTGIDVSVGDEAVLFNDVLTADELARSCNTISYEIICAIARRVPRVYITAGEIEDVYDYVL